MNKFAVLSAVVLVVVAAWFGGWFWAAGRIEAAIGALAEDAGEVDVRLTCARREVGGFPFRFDVTCEGARLTAGDLTIAAGGLKATVMAYNPTHAKVSALAPIEVADAYSGAISRFAFEALEASASLTSASLWRGLVGEGWRIRRLSVLIEAPAWDDVTAGERPILRASRAQVHLIDIPERHDPAAGIAALAAYGQLDDAVAPAQGIVDGQARLEAELTGLPDDLRAFDSEGALAAWHEAGGTLNLVRVHASSGDDFVEAKGTLSLDAAARLDGQATITSRGVVERMGDLVPPEWRGVILGAAAEDGTYSQRLNIKAGVVFSGLVPLAMLPPLM